MASTAPSVTCSAHSTSVRNAANPGQSSTWNARPPSSKLSGWSDSVKFRFFSSGSASSREVEPSGGGALRSRRGARAPRRGRSCRRRRRRGWRRCGSRGSWPCGRLRLAAPSGAGVCAARMQRDRFAAPRVLRPGGRRGPSGSRRFAAPAAERPRRPDQLSDAALRELREVLLPELERPARRAGPARPCSRRRSSTRRILPEMVFGSSANSMRRMRLYGASRRRRNRKISSASSRPGSRPGFRMTNAFGHERRAPHPGSAPPPPRRPRRARSARSRARTG